LKNFASILTLCAVLLLAGSAESPRAFAETTVLQDSSNVDMSSTKTWPAGPYSRVLLNYGVLQTVIPLFDIKGPGNSSLSFSIYNRTLQAGPTPGLPPPTYAAGTGGAGLGWESSVFSSAGSAEDPASRSALSQATTGNAVNYWTVNTENSNGVPTSLTRDPGTRADITCNTNGSGTLTGYDVINQVDKSDYNYSQPEVNYGSGTSSSTYYLSKITDTHGNITTYGYSQASGETVYVPTQVTDPAGRYYIINYGYYGTNTNLQISSVVLHCGTQTREWDFNYNELSQGSQQNPLLASITFPAPASGATRPTLVFDYNSSTNLSLIQDLNGWQWQYTYGLAFPISSNGSIATTQLAVASVVNPANGSNSNTTTAFSYGTDWQTVSGLTESIDQVTTVTDQLNNRFAYKCYYDGVHDSGFLPAPIETVTDPEVTQNGDNATYSESYHWNLSDCTLASYTDRNANTWNYTYDANDHGDLLTETDPLGYEKQYSYDAYDKLTQSIDENSDDIDYTYNVIHDLTKKVVDATGVAITTNYTYTTAGEISTEQTGSDAVMTYYDAYGNARTITPPTGATVNQSNFTFDAFNNETSDTEPSPSGTTTKTYDYWNRLVTVTNPDSTSSSIIYDNNSNVTQDIDENGHSTTNSYNSLNQLTQTSRQTSATASINVSFTYDAAGNKISVVNGDAAQTNFTYDQRHELIQTAYPGGETLKCDYTGDGKAAWSTDRNGNKINYTYDKDNRLTNTAFNDGTSFANTWRADGVRTQLVDSTGTTTWTINGAKQITTVVEPYAGSPINYTYDTSGRKKTMSYVYDSYVGQAWTYNYDGFLRPQSITQALGDPTAVVFSYYNNSALETEALGSGGLSTTYSYDTRGRTTEILSSLSSVTEQETQYSYDGASNILQYQDDITGSSSMTTGYGYDYDNRLLTEMRTGGPSSANFSNAYAYDNDGNRTSVTRNGTPSGYATGNNDEFQSGDGYSVPSYDGHGNPTALNGCAGTSFQFSYDLSDRPTALTLPGGVVETYKVDGDGHRVSKTFNGQTTRYIYDGDTVIAEIAPNGAVTYELPGIASYTTGATGGQSYYQTNQQGSTLALRSSTGTLQSQSEYDGYGIFYSLIAGPRTDFGYVGSKSYVTDPESGLLELGHRYYLPIIGRFLTQDPIGQEDDLNLYAYCHNNPVTNVDPTGDASALGVMRAWTIISEVGGGGPEDPFADAAAVIGDASIALGFGIAAVIVHHATAGVSVNLASRIRKQNYPHSVPPATRQKVIDKNKVDGEVIDPATDKPIDPGDISIEHKRPVVDHWNDEGRNQPRVDRVKWHNDPDNLTVKPNAGPGGNSQQGGRSTARYDPVTGPNYSR